jgi:PGF-CTERM protein
VVSSVWNHAPRFIPLEYCVQFVNRDSYAPNRREFVAGAVGVGAAGLGLDAIADETWGEYPETAGPSGVMEVVVRFEPADGGGTATLQQHAHTTQRPFEQFAADRPGVGIERRFWAANAALVSVDLGRVGRNAMLDVEGVTTVHPNYAVAAHDIAAETDAVATGESPGETEATDPTYHLEEMSVPQAREVYDTRGEGVDVAVIDTGVDTTGHEELAASLERGGWAEFDERGERVDSEPNAETAFPSAGHGTSTSGVIAGGTTDDGDRYGIAPGVNLHMVKHATQPPEGLRLLSVFAGIEWAIERDVDVLSMSLGLPQYNRAYLEPIRNAIDSGILVVNSIGNSGRDTSGSAGNLPGVLSVGGIDDDREPYENTGGERIDTDRYWGDDAAASWPAEYTVPDVTAPGVDVLGPVLDGQFERNTGTSFAAPCVAGVAALAMAATGADGEAVRDAITATARHPAAAAEFDVDPGHDDRYGRGIVSAMGAISRLEATETLSGRVTDASGAPLEGVTVASEAGPRTETDAQGRYELTVPPVTQPIGALGLGFETAAARIDPADTASRDFQLERTDALGVEMVDRMSGRIDPGTEATATFDVTNAETVSVEVETEGLFGPGDVELSVDGTPAASGESVGVDPDRTQLSVGVAVAESIPIGRVRLSYEFAGGGESRSGQGHLVHVHPDPYVLPPGEPPTLQAPIDLVAPGTTIELGDGQGAAVAESGDDAGLVVDKPLTLTAADGASPTVRFTDEGAGDAAVLLVSANDVTISGLDVDGAGAATGVQVGRGGAIPRALPHPSGVTIRDLTISGAATAVRTGQAPALRIVNNELTAGTTAISVGRRVEFRDTTTVTSRAETTVRENAITDVETGIDVAGQVAAIEENALSNVAGDAIHLGTPRFLSRHWGADIGPVRSNTITSAGRGIVVSGVLTRPLEENTLTDVAETALVVDGAVLAPIRSNRVDGARTALAVAEDAAVTTVTDNVFTNVRQPDDGDVSTDTEETETSGRTSTSETETTGSEGTAETPSATVTPPTAGPDDTEPEASDPGTSASDGSTPGFGVGSALATLGGAGYLLHRRLVGDETESE